jgi:hypothetical protein
MKATRAWWIVRTIALVSFACAVWYWFHVENDPEGVEEDALRINVAMKAAYLAGVMVLAAFTPAQLVARLDDLFERAGERWLWVSCGVVAVFAVLLAWITTEPILFGAGDLGLGYGHDGVFYGRIAEHYGPGLRIQPPMAFRVLPPLIVRWLGEPSGLGLDTFDGFRLLNLVCFGASCFVVARLALGAGARRAGALAAVVVFAGLKFALKYWVSYCVTTDALGTLLMLIATDAAVRKNHIVFALTLAVGVYTRENLFFLAPFHVIASWRLRKHWREPVFALIAAAAPIAVLFYARANPIVDLTYPYDPLYELELWGERFFFDGRRQQLAAYAWLNSLGILALLPVLDLRRTLTFLRTHAEWIFFFFAMSLPATCAGADYDRFPLWSMPLGVVLFAGGLHGELRGRGLVLILAVQLIAGELFLPWIETEFFQISRMAAHPQRNSFHYVASSVLSFVLAGGLVWATTRLRRPVQTAIDSRDAPRLS